MHDLLTQLNRVRGVGGALLVSADGLPMASALRDGTDEDELAAAFGGLIDGARRLCQTFALGTPIFINGVGDHGGLLLVATGPAFLGIVVDPSANQALLQLEIKPAIERLASRLTL